MNIDIAGDGPCDCPKGQCAHGAPSDDYCINRLDGDVRTHDCLKCEATTWHHEGSCLRCKAIAEGRLKP